MPVSNVFLLIFSAQYRLLLLKSLQDRHLIVTDKREAAQAGVLLWWPGYCIMAPDILPRAYTAHAHPNVNHVYSQTCLFRTP